MVKLRLKRMGSKFKAFYRVVAADARAPRDGRIIQEIGYYNPHSKEIRIDLELVSKWDKQGAVKSNTVKNLITKYNSIAKKSNEVVKLPIKMKIVKAAEEVVAAEVSTENTKTKE
ncbi:MAG: 30S ribosomal protein S16 [Mollicutes bacterium PWAP]|nr:30S ribosomal protein S16 [Mollicutes bacterium PWAP]